MNSVDCNILLYGMDRGSPEHAKALPIYESLINDAGEWVLADQTLFEVYRALRNAAIFRHPMGAAAAVERIRFLREKTAVQHCAYESRMWPEVMRLLARRPERKGILVFDVVLAVTLKGHGVGRFYTRNPRDFESFDLFEVVDPVG